MKISELISIYGDDKVTFQNLDESTHSIKMNKGIAKITFMTDQPVNFNGTEQLGLVIWLDRDRVSEIVKQGKDAET